jgi:hypothetical protein
MSREEVLKALKEVGLGGKFEKNGARTKLSIEEESDSKGIKDVTPISSEGGEEQEKV